MTGKLWELALALVVLAVAIKYVIDVVLPVLPIVLIVMAVVGALWFVFSRRARW